MRQLPGEHGCSASHKLIASLRIRKRKLTIKQTNKLLKHEHKHATPLYSISFACEERLKLKCLALLKTEKRKIPGIGLVVLHHSAAGIYQLILHHLKQLICFPSLIIL